MDMKNPFNTQFLVKQQAYENVEKSALFIPTNCWDLIFAIKLLKQYACIRAAYIVYTI